MKVVHEGQEDAIFVSLRNTGGVALEAASNHDGTRGIISTVQDQGMGGQYDNITLFTALWGQEQASNYGMFYADQAPGNAITVRKRVAGVTDSDPQIRVWDFDPDNSIDRNRYEAFNDGAVRISSPAASGSPQNSPLLRLRGADASTDREVKLQNVVTGSNQYHLSVQDESGNERMVVTQDGKVGIGTNSPDRILTLVNGGGNARADGWDPYSSRRWKRNIRTISGALGKVLLLRGVLYERTTDGRRQIGVVAEEVAKVAPEIVGYDGRSKEANSVEYGRLAALLIEAIKEQQRQIDQLKALARIGTEGK
jgi:Chaperone of endosialidase